MGSAGFRSFSNNSRRARLRGFRFTNATEIQRQAFFGTEILELTGTITGSSTVTGTLSTTAWSYAADGFTLNSGSTDRYAFVAIPPDFGAFAVTLHLEDPDDEVRIFVMGSEDARDCYEAGVWDDTGFKAQIRVTTDGVVATSPVANGAGDTPPSADCESDVSSLLNSGNSYTIEVRKALGFLEFRLNGETVARLKHEPQLWDGQIAVGFVSETDGARVLQASVSSLTGIVDDAEEVLAAVCDGDFWRTTSTTEISRVQAGTFPATGRVQMRPTNQVMLMLGPLVNGVAQARTYDVVRQDVDLWLPTSGTLPGQTLDGTTTAQVLSGHGTRQVLARIKGDEQNGYLSTVDDGTDDGGYLNFNTGSDLQGHAYVIASVRPLKLGKPIAAWIEFGNTLSIIGCDGAIERIIGDPAIGLYDTGIVSNNEGVSGDQAMILVREDRVLAHGPSGLMLIPNTGLGYPMAQNVLVTGLELDPTEAEDNLVILARDPVRSWVWIFKTPRDGTAGSHLLYDELTGRYKVDAPGFWEMSLPAEIQPTCACIWRNILVVGCQDGYLRYFVDGVYSDEGTDGDLAIEAFVPAEVLASTSLREEVVLANPTVELRFGSDPVRMRVYGARSPSKVYAESSRTILMDKLFDQHQHEPLPVEVRSPALLVEIRNDTVGENMTIEMLEADVVISGDRT
jgi:hypothetical protein